MKKTMKLMLSFSLIGSLLLIMACGGGSGKKAELTEKGELLTSISWKLDPNATLKGSTDAIEDTTGITADIELKGDVKAFADFVAETVVFGVDTKDPSKLSYSRTIGEGLLSSSVLGYWEFNADETAIIMKEWDSQAGKEKAPVTYTIVELSPEKLVLQKEGDASPNIYFPKK
jgi:hypothetical protein